ncbi:MAG TPA: preprotein translocase subunit SecE [Planctomycetota bacterium]|nr:preprotein translocase subunit SecE [Planctomycetota bacterium]
MFRRHRPTEGHLARTLATWSLTAFALYGCVSLHRTVQGWGRWWQTPLGGVTLPVLGVKLTPAILLATLVGVAAFVALRIYLERPRAADLLIATEEEMRRVTWPSTSDVVDSSLVVIATVVVLGVFLAGSDALLGALFRYLIFSGEKR